MSKNAISNSVIRRLPRYYRFLGELEANGCVRISSRELSEKMGLTASQIRQDLNCFGGFGQQGYGYNVSELHEEIGKILGVRTNNPTILLGAGNLGRAIASHIDFQKRGFNLIAVFDSNPELTGKIIGSHQVKNITDLEEFCSENKPVTAVLCIPQASAPDMADKLISYGIRAFWNFSHYDLSVTHENVIVENVHLGDSLLILSYGLKSLENSSEE